MDVSRSGLTVGVVDPAGYLGAADTWINRALALYREER